MRHPRSYKRRGPQKEPYDSVLIVCEGRKTEPQYLEGVKQAFRLGNTLVTPADGTDPVSIVRSAQSLNSALDKYDRVYCVFDRNGHDNFSEAIGLIRQLGYHPIVSWPCFEIWILLHFVYSTAPFNPIGGKSACDLVLREVTKHFPNYAKGLPGVYGQLKLKIDGAIAHANRLAEHNVSTQSYNPSTRMHELVDYLRKLKS
jgi:hypothetical protein